MYIKASFYKLCKQFHYIHKSIYNASLILYIVINEVNKGMIDKNC